MKSRLEVRLAWKTPQNGRPKPWPIDLELARLRGGSEHLRSRPFASPSMIACVRVGEGFRMPAMASHSSRHGPAYENRPSTNPRGCGDGLWGLRVLVVRGDGEINSVLVSAGT